MCHGIGATEELFQPQLEVAHGTEAHSRIMATIRFAAASDSSDLFDLVRAFPTPTPPRSERFPTVLKAKLADPSSCLLVAEEEGCLVGYVSGYCHATFYAGGVTAWVDELLVLAPFRGTGVGRQLMDAFEAWATDRRSVLVSLATRGAAAFYEHRGYTSKAGYYKKYLATDSPL
jgi:GNAT superfamily N-acetyltransferase